MSWDDERRSYYGLGSFGGLILSLLMYIVGKDFTGIAETMFVFVLGFVIFASIVFMILGKGIFQTITFTIFNALTIGFVIYFFGSVL